MMSEEESREVIRAHYEKEIVERLTVLDERTKSLHERVDTLQVSINSAASTAKNAADATVKLQNETRDVLEAWKTATAGLKFFSVLGRIGQFVIYIGSAIAIVYAAFKFFRGA